VKESDSFPLNTNSKRAVTKPRDKTNAERQRRFRAKQENCEILKDKNIASCAKYRMKVKSLHQKNSLLDELIDVVLSRPQLADGRGIQMIFNPNEIAKCKQHLLNM